MNQIFAAAAALLLGGVLWGLGKKPKGFNPSFLLPIASRSLSLKKKSFIFSSKLLNEQSQTPWVSPNNAKERLNLRKKLGVLITLGPEERLEAVKIASSWGDPSVLSIIKRGLSDSDSRVVLLAAEAMEKFRSYSNQLKPDPVSRRPRNVFLMR